MPSAARLDKKSQRAFEKQLAPMFPSPADRAALGPHRRRFTQLLGSIPEAFRAGADGFYHDIRRGAGQEAWGFSLDEVRCENVVIVHGADDRNVPASHSAHYHAQIAGSTLHVVPGEGHLSLVFGRAQQVVDCVASLWTGQAVQW